MRLQVISVVVTAIAMFSTNLEAREWTDHTGRHRTEAELIGREGETVWFKDTNGRRRSVAFERLSTDDRAFIVEHERQTASKMDVSADKQPPSVIHTASTGSQSRPKARKVATKLTSDARSASSAFKLAGWCTSGHCYHPHPHPPAPPKPPLPEFGKRIYHGHWSTWHLVHLPRGPSGGTGRYLLTESGKLVCHLALLTFKNADANYWYFETNDPNPGFRYWRFSSHAAGSCWYSVEYSVDGKTYYFYEYCRVKQPV